MFKYILLIMAVAFIGTAQAQNTIKFHLKKAETNEPIKEVSAKIEETNSVFKSDNDGNITIGNLKDGNYTLSISVEGYAPNKTVFKVPSSPNFIEIALHSEEEEAEEMEEIVVMSTRGTRTISNIPTRVEFIAGEELEEKANMKPGDIRMMLNESTGIQTQQTSATSGNSSVRIQGLDGRYTQILKDGFSFILRCVKRTGIIADSSIRFKAS